MQEPENHPPEFRDLYRGWMQIRNKMNIMENMPHKFGMETPLFLSETQTIARIKKRSRSS